MRYIGILIVLLMSMMNTVAQSPSATECPDDFVGYLSPQLIVGERARVVIDIQLNVRPEPSVNEARLGTLALS